MKLPSLRTILMLAARLYGPRDIRIDDVPPPPDPGRSQVVIDVTSVGICGSDLHTYQDGRIGDTLVTTPLVLGHEFAGIVTTVGPDAADGLGAPLRAGQRVAVDPATPCYRCEMCEMGHPNLCRRLHFHGLWPDDGALQRQMLCAARSCFPVPEGISDDAAALLEPLGIAMHAVDLGRLRLARSVAVLGCGPIGLLIVRLARLSGAAPIYAFDCFAWRAEKAVEWGAHQSWTVADHDPVQTIDTVTDGRGVDVVFEAAWADHSIAQAVEMARMGGRVVLVGIPSDDNIVMKHSTARRKGLNILLSRRMKHTYPRAIRMAQHNAFLRLDDLVSHRYSLRETNQAFAFNVEYQPGVHKIMIDAQK